jgi:hypothetical protein
MPIAPRASGQEDRERDEEERDRERVELLVHSAQYTLFSVRRWRT